VTVPFSPIHEDHFMPDEQTTERKPFVCIPWEEKRKEFPPITGDEELVRKIWEDVDALAYLYIWHCLLSF